MRVAAGVFAAALLLAVPAAARVSLVAPQPADVRPQWSHDGTAIAFFSTRDGPGLRVAGPRGEGDRRLVETQSWLPWAFSRDWFWLALVDTRGRLSVGRPEGADRQVVAETQGAESIAFAPDGSRLAFADLRGVHVVGVDGSGLKTLSPAGRSVAWSPRIDWIAYVGSVGPSATLSMVPADASQPSRATDAGPRPIRAPQWAPEGLRIAYLTGDGRHTALRISTTEDRLASRIPVPFATSLSWSPDGRLVASGDGLYRIDLPDERPVRLTSFGTGAVWSPDGRQIAFSGAGQCKNRSGIYVVAAAGGTPEPITNDCRVRGTPGPDRIRGTGLTELIYGLAGHDRLEAVDQQGAGDDLYGGPGNDELVGGGWPNRLDGSAGADILRGGRGQDTLIGGAGRDVLEGEQESDLVLAVDGARDTLDCGYGAFDIAYVDARDRVRRCELAFRTSSTPVSTTSLTALRITLWPRGRIGPARTRTLSCAPSAGSVRHAAAACRALARLSAPFSPVPPDAVCRQVDGGPQTALVVGSYRGAPVYSRFNRRSDCQLARWKRVSFLFP